MSIFWKFFKVIRVRFIDLRRTLGSINLCVFSFVILRACDVIFSSMEDTWKVFFYQNVISLFSIYSFILFLEYSANFEYQRLPLVNGSLSSKGSSTNFLLIIVFFKYFLVHSAKMMFVCRHSSFCHILHFSTHQHISSWFDNLAWFPSIYRKVMNPCPMVAHWSAIFFPLLSWLV